jgi:hypothetical protein
MVVGNSKAASALYLGEDVDGIAQNSNKRYSSSVNMIATDSKGYLASVVHGPYIHLSISYTLDRNKTSPSLNFSH